MGAIGWGSIIRREYGSRQWRSWSFGLYDAFQSRRTSSFSLRNFCFATLICIISLFSLLQIRGKPCLRFFAIARVVCICICLGENPSTEAALRPPLHCKAGKDLEGPRPKEGVLMSSHRVIRACEQTQPRLRMTRTPCMDSYGFRLRCDGRRTMTKVGEKQRRDAT
jgi:hypothetical protein